MTKVTAISAIEHDGKLYEAGDSIEVTAEQAEALKEAGVIETGRAAEAQEGEVVEEPSKPKTKAELLSEAEAEGLTLEVTDKNTVAEINAAIEAARAANTEE